MFCAPRRQYRAAAAVLSHLAARDIMEPALKATVLCVPGSRGEGEVEKEGEVEEEMEEEKEEEMGVEKECKYQTHVELCMFSHINFF